MFKSIGLLVIASLPVLAQDAAISAERIREHTRFLSCDLLEGRGTGTRGGQLATEYLATQLALAGAKPAGDNGGFFQQGAPGGGEAPPAPAIGGAGWGRGGGLWWGGGLRGERPARGDDTPLQGA